MFGGNFAPAGWALCDGQLLPISENDPLFQLIGTTYGGDGQNNFALPNLQGRIPVHQGPVAGFFLGEAAGAEEVTLAVNRMPLHSHGLAASADQADAANPQGKVWGQTTETDLYRGAGSQAAMNGATVGPTGGSQPHNNMQPFLCVTFIISLFGVFPSP